MKLGFSERVMYYRYVDAKEPGCSLLTPKEIWEVLSVNDDSDSPDMTMLVPHVCYSECQFGTL